MGRTNSFATSTLEESPRFFELRIMSNAVRMQQYFNVRASLFTDGANCRELDFMKLQTL